jgi:predicted metal-dependent hydrolase
MDEKYIIDRIEGNYAIIEKENGDMHKISIKNIKGDFKDGDILINKGKYFEIHKKFTLNRKNEINNSMKNMWEE